MTQGLWDYAHDRQIADDYDEYFAYNQLFQFDLAVLNRHFREPGRLIDLGCGTGRLMVPFAQRGFDCVGVDLSLPMLRVVGEKAAAAELPIRRLRANLTELGCLATACTDYCICMFSTLGMIRGRANRQRVLEHARRIVRPGGKFAIHVHNFWYNLLEPLGRAWVVRNLFWDPWFGGLEVGDKFFDYRGVPNMFLHVFTQGELRTSLRRAGFVLRDWIPLDTQRQQPLQRPWFLGRFRANGWIAICQ